MAAVRTASLASASLALVRCDRNDGMAIAASAPMITITTSSSTRVKPPSCATRDLQRGEFMPVRKPGRGPPSSPDSSEVSRPGWTRASRCPRPQARPARPGMDVRRRGGHRPPPALSCAMMADDPTPAGGPPPSPLVAGRWRGWSAPAPSPAYAAPGASPRPRASTARSRWRPRRPSSAPSRAPRPNGR